MAIDKDIIKDIIIEELEVLESEIKKALKDTSLGYRGKIEDTGKAAASLEITKSGTHIALIGNEYFYQLQFGRRPGTYAPVQNIRDWVRSKLNVPVEDVNSIAYLVNRKIYNKGTTIYENRAEGLHLEELTLNTLDRITEKILDASIDAVIGSKTFTYDF